MGKFTQTNRDQNITLKLSVIRGNGVVAKGLFKKTKEYQFQTQIDIINNKYFKICDLKSYYYTKNGEAISLKCSEGRNSYLVPTSNLDGNCIKVKVELTYKVSTFVKKTVTVACNATI